MNLRLRAVTAALLLVACAHAPKTPAPEEDLAGLTLQLDGGPTLRWVVSGEVSGRRAEVDLDLAAPLSMVSTACFAAAPESKATVSVRRVSGEYEALPEVTLPQTAIAGRHIRPRPAGLFTSTECKVVLGTDVLGGYVFHFSPRSWEVRVERPAQPLPEGTALRLSRDPETDRLLVPVRVVPAVGNPLVANFILSTTTPRTLLSEAAANAARIETDRAVIARLNLPAAPLQPLLHVSTFSVQSIELAEDVEVGPITLDGTRQWAQPAAVGVLGPDVWGRFEAILDLPNKTLHLRRPDQQGEAVRRTCGPDATQEDCFQLHATPAPTGVRTTLTVWRELSTGGRVYLEPLDAEGKTARAPCRIGFNLPAGGRGQSISQVFPWPELEKAFPACGEALKEAQGANLLLFEEGVDPQCSGECALAVHPRGRAMVCSCASAPGQGNPNTTERALELFRRLRDSQLRRSEPATTEEEPEPED